MVQDAGRRQRKAGAVALLIVGVVTFSCSRPAWVAAPGQGAASRRDALNSGLLGLVSATVGAAPANSYELPPLPYAFDALEPSIDKETMEIHHDRHHNTYVTNINKAFEGKEQPPLLDIQKDAIKTSPAWRNSGGGAYNHNFFWLEMAPKGAGGEPSAELSEAIKDAFGSFGEFQERFEAAGAPGARFGSGWVWLVVTKDGKLAITSTPNQDNPLMAGVDATEGIPVLGIDVWEHAYYLKYQWQRPAYIKAWWDVVNWNQVNAWYKDALQGKAPTADSAYVGAAMVGARRPAGQLRAPEVPRSFKFGFEAQAQFDF